jgi:hypothetical protein
VSLVGRRTAGDGDEVRLGLPGEQRRRTASRSLPERRLESLLHTPLPNAVDGSDADINRGGDGWIAETLVRLEQHPSAR